MVEYDYIRKLPIKIEIERISLELDKKIHRGRNNLSDIIWYKYKIVNKEKDIFYDSVCLCFFKITEEVRIEAAKRIISKGVSKEETERPHIDYKTGNIHPNKKYVEEQNNGKIKQLVLCNGLGPGALKKQINDNFYVYKNTPRQFGIKIHKACYYPLIDDNQNLKNDWRYKFLENIWKNIDDGLKEEN